MKYIFLSTLTIISLFMSLPALAQISGHVGPINNLNKGLAQLTVRAFDAQNQRLTAINKGQLFEIVSEDHERKSTIKPKPT